MITIIIATKNRSAAIARCIGSILDNTYKNFELIVADQSTNDETETLIGRLNNKKIIYMRNSRRGKSRSLNEAIIQSTGNILAFTDDDCIVSRHWLQSISKTFASNTRIDAAFGQTKPYGRSPVPNAICPSIFPVSRSHTIRIPEYHSTTIGFGNNMAIRKTALKTVGGFHTWLGPGSIGLSAEDADMALRILLAGHTIYSDAGMVVYHNKWVTSHQARIQELIYTGAETACYGYFRIQGYGFALRVLNRGWKTAWKRFGSSVSNLGTNLFSRKSWGALFWSVAVLACRSWGAAIAWYYSRTQPLTEKFSVSHTT